MIRCRDVAVIGQATHRPRTGLWVDLPITADP
jgi:hypothetical protein